MRWALVSAEGPEIFVEVKIYENEAVIIRPHSQNMGVFYEKMGANKKR